MNHFYSQCSGTGILFHFLKTTVSINLPSICRPKVKEQSQRFIFAVIVKIQANYPICGDTVARP